MPRRYQASNTRRSTGWEGSGVPVIDTTNMTVEETVAAITGALEQFG